MKKNALLFLLCLSFASCNPLESVNPKTEEEQTIELLTKGGVWNLDSATWKITSVAPGLELTLNDSVFLSYGTWEFQAPVDVFTRFGTGYLIHSYSKNGMAKIDTLAWLPYAYGSTSDDRFKGLTIWYPDSSIPNGQLVVDDMEHHFLYLQKDNNLVRINGNFGFSVGVSTQITHARTYRLTR